MLFRSLHDTRLAALALYAKLQNEPRFVTAFPPELDIVIWAVRAARVSEASAQARLLGLWRGLCLSMVGHGMSASPLRAWL